MSFDTAGTVLRRAVVLGAAFGVGIGLLAGLLGLVTSGPPGLWTGLVGAGLSIAYLGLTAAGLLATQGVARRGGRAVVTGLVVAWFLKLALFVAVMLALHDQPWVVPQVLLVSVVATVMASLIVDAVVVGRARIPVSDRV